MTDYDDEDPIASWEAAFLPNWEWEAYDKDDEDVYFGRVKSPNTYGNWEYGYFTQGQLEKAGAYRTDLDSNEDAPVYPDGGEIEDVVGLFEPELEPILERGDER